MSGARDQTYILMDTSHVLNPLSNNGNSEAATSKMMEQVKSMDNIYKTNIERLKNAVKKADQPDTSTPEECHQNSGALPGFSFHLIFSGMKLKKLAIHKHQTDRPECLFKACSRQSKDQAVWKDRKLWNSNSSILTKHHRKKKQRLTPNLCQQIPKGSLDFHPLEAITRHPNSHTGVGKGFSSTPADNKAPSLWRLPSEPGLVPPPDL